MAILKIYWGEMRLSPETSIHIKPYIRQADGYFIFLTKDKSLKPDIKRKEDFIRGNRQLVYAYNLGARELIFQIHIYTFTKGKGKREVVIEVAGNDKEIYRKLYWDGNIICEGNFRGKIIGKKIPAKLKVEKVLPKGKLVI